MDWTDRLSGYRNKKAESSLRRPAGHSGVGCGFPFLLHVFTLSCPTAGTQASQRSRGTGNPGFIGTSAAALTSTATRHVQACACSYKCLRPRSSAPFIQPLLTGGDSGQNPDMSLEFPPQEEEEGIVEGCFDLKEIYNFLWLP